MPSRCCVPLCKGNYPTGPKVAVFSFPRDEELSGEWIRAIKRDNFTPNHSSRVCELHFVPGDIEETSYFDERTGTNLTVNLKIPRLHKGAVPSQLPNCPTYLSRTPLIREFPEERKCRKEQDAIRTAIAESVEDEVQHLMNISFENLSELSKNSALLTSTGKLLNLITPY
ncbi:uncharacterized protein LOC123520642 [Portunus trituberculatus]|uniref:uncharacterized protein LOC123520642 n=1 Tax=Portunus trituberculatus TaxID=210409 RepID=UPI001E1CCE44|nr:uncharacterized protein LOC123520642 [Portunus trituberculatus]